MDQFRANVISKVYLLLCELQGLSQHVSPSVIDENVLLFCIVFGIMEIAFNFIGYAAFDFAAQRQAARLRIHLFRTLIKRVRDLVMKIFDCITQLVS